jgi:hypothetical protein
MGSENNICPGQSQTVILLISAFQVARITGVSHQHSAEYLLRTRQCSSAGYRAVSKMKKLCLP